MIRRIPVRRGLLLVTVVLSGVLAAAAPSVRVEAPVAGAQQGEDPALLRELTERLLGSTDSGGISLISEGEGRSNRPPRAPRMQLVPGQLPDDPRFELPLPPGSRILGTALRRDIGRTFNFISAVDVPEDGGDVIGFFSSALGERGWTAAPQLSLALFRSGGFSDPLFESILSRPQPANRFAAEFCKGAGSRAISLEVYVYAGRAGMLDVRIAGDTSGGYRCELPSVLSAARTRLPDLNLPAGSELLIGSSGTDRPVASEVTVRSEKSPADLEAEIAGQLVAAGWTRRDGGAEGITAWSTWSIPDREDWRGFLTVTAEPGKDNRILRLEMRSPASDRPRRLPRE